MIKVPLLKSSRRNRGKMVHKGKATRGAELRSEMLGQPEAESHTSLLTFYHCYEICPFIFNTAENVMLEFGCFTEHRGFPVCLLDSANTKDQKTITLQGLVTAVPVIKLTK